MAPHQLLLLDDAEEIQQFLGPADGKRRDHHVSAPVKGVL